MDDASSPAPTMQAKAVRARRNRTSFVVVTVTAGLGATLLMAGLAHAEPMISSASMLSAKSPTQAMGLDGERVLFGMLTFGFSLIAAGVWHRSFRAIRKPDRHARH
jgi:hypothetical protein